MSNHDAQFEEDDTEVELSDGTFQPMLPMNGSVVDGRYLVIKEIGEGGFGWVFKVQHILLGQYFAMKILHPRISADPKWRVRFREEARATSLIGHENIVFVTDFGECNRYGYYFVMEYLEGSSLAERLRAGPMDVQATLRFAVAAASALGAVHELGIVHCDLKPGNVMIVERPGRNEMWKFLDFGTSNIVTTTVNSDFIYGTPAYMAPEQAIGLDLDARADQFSLACIIYEMLTGQLPWRVETWTDALPEARRKSTPKPITDFRNDCPPELDRVIQNALSVRRSGRYASVEEFVKAIRETIEIEFVPAHDPQDIKNAPAKGGGFQRSPTAPRVAQLVDAGSSMVITLGEDSAIEDATSEVNIVFISADRLGREWRRNMIAGGLFIPSNRVLPVDEKVHVNLTLAPRGLSIELDGRVVSQTLTGGPAEVGFGVMLSATSQLELERWIKNPVIGLEYNPRDILTRIRDLNLNDTLTSSEAFLVTMLAEPLPVQRLRGMCSGLPMDFNETIASLIQKKYIEIEQPDATEARDDLAQASFANVSFTARDVERIMDQADFFERQNNFWGAISTLRRAAEILPEKSSIKYRLAKLENSFLANRSEATRLMQQALKIEPRNQEYLEFMSNLDAPSSDPT